MRLIKLPHSIAAKLILSLMAVSLLLIVFTSVLQLRHNYIQEIARLESRIYDIEQSFVPPITNSLWLTDMETLQWQVVGIQGLPEISYVEIVAGGREIAVAGTPPPKGSNIISRSFPLVQRYRDKDLTLGTLHLYGDLTAVHNRLAMEAWGIFWNRLATIAVIFATLFFLYLRFVGRHLKVMAEYLKAFEHGQMNTPLVLAKRSPASKEEMDELDQVVHTFNETRQKLKRSFDSLHQVNVELMRENRERVKAEESLRESEQRYALLVNTIPEVFWLVSADYQQVLFISPAYEAIWGRSCESLLAAPRSWFDAIVEEDQSAVAAVVDSLTKGEDIPSQAEFPEYRVRRPDGTIRWIKAKVVPLRDEAGKVWSFAGLCEDITSAKETDDKLRQAQKMEAIGTLAGGIAHDFNNILAAILGYADLIRYEMSATDPNRKNIEEVIKAGNRAKTLVQQILSFSRKSQQQRRPVAVAPLVKEALKLLRASIPTTIAIEAHITEPGGTVLADPIQIHQVVVNLCTNASHAMEAQGGTMAVSLDAVDVVQEEADTMGGHPGRYIRLTVADDGYGMDEATRQRIFDPYFTTKEFGKGSGMGLAVVHGIVQGYGGMIRLASTLGKGSTFEIFFPAIDLAPEPEAAEICACPRGSERILLVDDEPAIIDMSKQWLTRLGYTVMAVTSSLEALALFRNSPHGFDLLVTDQTMPHLPGSELAKEVLAIRPELPILLCTGYSSMVTEDTAREIGIRRYAHKPLPGSELSRIVREMLDEQAASPNTG